MYVDVLIIFWHAYGVWMIDIIFEVVAVVKSLPLFEVLHIAFGLRLGVDLVGYRVQLFIPIEYNTSKH